MLPIYLYSVISRIRHNDVAVSINAEACGIRELTSTFSSAPKTAGNCFLNREHVDTIQTKVYDVQLLAIALKEPTLGLTLVGNHIGQLNPAHNLSALNVNKKNIHLALGCYVACSVSR